MKILKPIIIIFIVLVSFILSADKLWINYDVDKNVLLAANVLFLTMALLVFFMQKKAMDNKNPNVFVRSVIAGMMIKMFGTMIAVLIYVTIISKVYNTKAIFIALLMYLVYLGAEVMAISKQLKQR
jgi:RsiW-degrading membrane proteinase PrsW (M82 family)